MVVGMEDACRKGWLSGAVVLLATDNEVVERALYKGNSSSKALFDLVLRLKGLQLTYSYATTNVLCFHIDSLLTAEGSEDKKSVGGDCDLVARKTQKI